MGHRNNYPVRSGRKFLTNFFTCRHSYPYLCSHICFHCVLLTQAVRAPKEEESWRGGRHGRPRWTAKTIDLVRSDRTFLTIFFHVAIPTLTFAHIFVFIVYFQHRLIEHQKKRRMGAEGLRCGLRCGLWRGLQHGLRYAFCMLAGTNLALHNKIEYYLIQKD